MNKVVILVFLLLTFLACSNKSNKSKFDKVDLIYKAIGLLEKGDSDFLKLIVDTTQCYEI